jgi:hypothetical protein
MAIVLMTAYIGNNLTALLVSLLGIVLFWFGVHIVCKLLKSIGVSSPLIKTISDITTGGYQINTCFLPTSMKACITQVTRLIESPGDRCVDIDNRFLEIIKGWDMKIPVPQYMLCTIEKKILWEYQKKYGHLNYRFFNGYTLHIQDVFKPVDQSELIAFQQFCIAHHM